MHLLALGLLLAPLFTDHAVLQRDRPVPIWGQANRDDSGYRVRFIHSEGLKSRQPLVPGFAVAGADRVFHPASARIDGESVRVWNPAIPHPEALRYAWSNSPSTDLSNGAGLPVAPFRSDQW